jgi:hypothetical protein
MPASNSNIAGMARSYIWLAFSPPTRLRIILVSLESAQASAWAI